MGCTGCSTDDATGKPAGCGSNGTCGTGGCNKLNTYDWLTAKGIVDSTQLDIVEVSFKKGASKDFYYVPHYLTVSTGEDVVVDTGNGYDVGFIGLSGELVRLQMKKKGINPKKVTNKVIRLANKNDIEKLQEARKIEHRVMLRARAIARTLGIDMKIGDVQYQGDLRKATFYYTADGRVDFRELVRSFAKEFRVKIEMRQIGARQESGRIGGIGPCGRELCCSTWLTNFSSVSTSAARYQNLSLNQSKLSGQCGRLKCCLNYELDTYIEALKDFPKKADKLYLEYGKAVLVKTDIFKKIMYYSYSQGKGRSTLVPMDVERVKEILDMNKNGEKPLELKPIIQDTEEIGYSDDVTGVVELPKEKKSKRKKRRKSKSRNRNRSNRPQANKSSGKPSQNKHSKGRTDNGNKKGQSS